MANLPGLLPTRQALAMIEGALDQVTSDRSELPAEARLVCARAARRAADRLEALACLLVAEADAAQASLTAAGTPMSSWLAIDQNLSKRESAGLLHRAQALAENPQVGEAAVAGRIGAGQARTITTVLQGLPDLSPSQRADAATFLVGLAGTLDADQLAKAGSRVIAEVAPEQAAELVEQRLQRRAETAHRNRSLVFSKDGLGSALFRGSLPLVDAEAWLAILDAHAESQRRNALEERDPLAVPVSPQQRRADALMAMVHAHQQAATAPAVGGDRPRVVVTLDYDKLHSQASAAGLIGDGEHLSGGELRRLCCDADLLPAVLGGPSEVLDVGRGSRLVTPAIRAALTVRDQGCAFPRCHARPAVCEAHHLTPWWDGGATALHNLVLLCHHHHGMVEPAKWAIRDQWQMRLGPDGIPEAIPPRRFDSHQQPVRHQRYQHPEAIPPPSPDCAPSVSAQTAPPSLGQSPAPVIPGVSAGSTPGVSARPG